VGQEAAVNRPVLPIRDVALAVARGGHTPEQGATLAARLADLASRLDFPVDARDGAPAVVFIHWHRSLHRHLDALRDHAGTDASRQVRRCSRRGASAAEIAGVLGRPLSEAEEAALDPFADDGAATGYFVNALKNACRDLLPKPLPPPPTPPPEPPPLPPWCTPEALAAARRFMDTEVLPPFARSNPDEMRWLMQLERGEAAQAIAEAALGAGASPKALKTGRNLVFKHWQRARDRLQRLVEEDLKGDKEFRTRMVQALLCHIEERFRRNAAPVRVRPPRRLTGEEEEPQ